MTTTPTLPTEGGFLRLPGGVGTLVFGVQTVNTHKVRFYLSPTGTNTSTRLLGEDTNRRDGWTLAWHYPDQAVAAHLTVKATGAQRDQPRHRAQPVPPQTQQLTPATSPASADRRISNSLWTGPGICRGRQPSGDCRRGPVSVAPKSVRQGPVVLTLLPRGRSIGLRRSRVERRADDGRHLLGRGHRSRDGVDARRCACGCWRCTRGGGGRGTERRRTRVVGGGPCHRLQVVPAG